MENRQQLNNPYANISNPFANLSVATEAAKFQAEQSDIALANTLDNLRQTGAGGATALAQAALQSKKGVSANIQQQEAQNQRLKAQEIYSTQAAMSSLGAAAQTLAGGIIPSQLPEGSGSTTGNTSFTSGATEAANQAGIDLINNIKLMEVPEIPDFDFSLSADIFANPQGSNTWQKSGLSNMVKERDRLRQAGQSTAEIQGLIDSTRQKFGI